MDGWNMHYPEKSNSSLSLKQEIKTLKYLDIPYPDTLMDGQDAEPLPVRPLVEWSDVQSTSAWLGQPAESLYKWVSAESAGWTAQRKRNTHFGSKQLLGIAKYTVRSVMHQISSFQANKPIPHPLPTHQA